MTQPTPSRPPSFARPSASSASAGPCAKKRGRFGDQTRWLCRPSEAGRQLFRDGRVDGRADQRRSVPGSPGRTADRLTRPGAGIASRTAPPVSEVNPTTGCPASRPALESRSSSPVRPQRNGPALLMTGTGPVAPLSAGGQSHVSVACVLAHGKARCPKCAPAEARPQVSQVWGRTAEVRPRVPVRLVPHSRSCSPGGRSNAPPDRNPGPPRPAVSPAATVPSSGSGVRSPAPFDHPYPSPAG